MVEDGPMHCEEVGLINGHEAKCLSLSAVDQGREKNWRDSKIFGVSKEAPTSLICHAPCFAFWASDFGIQIGAGRLVKVHGVDQAVSLIHHAELGQLASCQQEEAKCRINLATLSNLIKCLPPEDVPGTKIILC